MTSWLDRKIEKAKIRPVPERDKVFVGQGPISRPPLPPRGSPDRKPTAADIIWFIENKCYVPEGKLMGTKFKLAPWQKAEIRRIYNNPVGTRRAILSFGRKNGKTALAALLLLVHLIGPKAVANSQLYSAAQSRDQASLIFNLAAKIVRMSPELRDFVYIKDSGKELHCIKLGTKYRALSADATTAYGLSPAFIIHDELGEICPRKQIKPLQNMGSDGHMIDSVLSISPRSKRPDPHETWLSMALNRTAGKLRESSPWEHETPPGRD